MMKQFVWFILLSVVMGVGCRHFHLPDPPLEPGVPAHSPQAPAQTYLPTLLGEGSCPQPLCYSSSWSLAAAQNRSLEENVLKLFTVATDETSQRVYVAGIMTPDIGVMDSTTGNWITTIPTGIEGTAIKYLFVDSVAHYLYLIDQAHSQLWRIHLDNYQLDGPVSIPFSNGLAVVDTTRAIFYLMSRELPGFYAYGGQPFHLLYTNAQMGEDTGEVIYDPLEDQLYILGSENSQEQRKIYVFDPAEEAVVEEIVYDTLPGQRSQWLAWDGAEQKFMVATTQRVLILDRLGNELSSFALPTGLEIRQLAYDNDADRVIVLGLQQAEGGEVANTNGHLLTLHPVTGQILTDLSFGIKPQRFTYSPELQKIYLPNGDASVVWQVDTQSYNQVVAIRLGDSLEQVVPTVDGTVYLSSRLGGSYLAAYDSTTGALETFNAGTWPIPVRTDPTGQHLFVLNAWDSTLSVYATTPERTLLGTVPLGLPKGTTDRLPDLTIDATHQLAYIAYPEFGQIAVVNWATLAPVTLISVADFPTGDIGGGPGQLQVAVNEAEGLLFAFWLNSRRLTAYAADSGYAQVADVHLQELDWEIMTNAGNADQLFFDQSPNRLFVGAFELNGSTGQPTGRILEQGQRIFAFDAQNGVYWASAATGTKGNLTNQIVAIDGDSLAVRYASTLSTPSTIAPTFAFDPVRHQIYVGYLTTAILESFTVGSVP